MFFGGLYKILVQGSLSQTDSLSQDLHGPFLLLGHDGEMSLHSGHHSLSEPHFHLRMNHFWNTNAFLRIWNKAQQIVTIINVNSVKEMIRE